MHRMVARDGQARHDRLASALRRDFARGERVAHDAIIGLGVDHAVIEYEAGAAGPAVPAACNGFTEPLDDVGVPIAMRVLQRDGKASGRNWTVVVIDAAPGV